MAYSITNGAILECRMRHIQAGQEMMVVRHYRYDGATPIADGAAAALQLAQHIDNGVVTVGPGRYGAAWRAIGSEIGVSLYAVEAQWVYPIRYGPQRSSVVIFGNIAGDPVPSSVSAFVELRAEKSGKHFRGGMHVPGLAASGVTIQSTWSNDTLTGLQALGDAMTQQIPVGGPLTQGPWTPIIFNRASPTTSADVTQAIAMPTTRTMRRRVVGLGI